jgi:hypothetical protein
MAFPSMMRRGMSYRSTKGADKGRARLECLEKKFGRWANHLQGRLDITSMTQDELEQCSMDEDIARLPPLPLDSTDKAI